jgi:hypothetical protein
MAIVSADVFRITLGVSVTCHERFHCITCGTVYSQLCGKSLDAGATQNHQIDKFEYKTNRAYDRVVRRVTHL